MFVILLTLLGFIYCSATDTCKIGRNYALLIVRER